MGITGTAVAKEAADMILLDDNFASIVNGVEEGRLIFDNLKKSIAYTVSHLLPELVPFIFNQLIGVPLGLTTVLIFLIDIGTELMPAISMAHEPMETGIMSRRPRNPNSDHLVTWKLLSFAYLQTGILESLGCYYGFFCCLCNVWIQASMVDQYRHCR